MLHDIHLYGFLAEKYGSKHKFDIDTAPEAARALAANYKTFRADFADGNYRVVVGDLDTGTDLDKEMLDFRIGHTQAVHIIPLAMGAKNGGGIKAIAGIALLTVATWGAASAIGAGVGLGAGFGATMPGALGALGATWGNLAGIGLSLAFSGVSALLSPTPKVTDYGQREAPDQRASFLFNSVVNRGAEGAAVSIIYGECIVGSTVISGGIETEKLL